MDTIAQAIPAAVAAVVAALTPIAWQVGRAVLDYLKQRALLTVQQRLGEAAARIAAEIAAEVAADPGVQAATQQMLDVGAAALNARFAQEVARRGIPRTTLEGMVAGELGKLGVAVKR